jgi:hypothetical protein
MTEQKPPETEPTNPDPAPPATQDPTQDAQGADETAPEADGGTQAHDDTAEAALAAGFHGAIPSQGDDVDDALTAKTVEDAAADQDTDQADYFGVLPDTDKSTVPVPMADQKAPPRRLTQTEDARVGYFGELPPGPGPDGEREDLTLAAAAQDARDQYGDGKPDDA